MLDSSTWKFKTFMDSRFYSDEDFEGSFSGILYVGTTPDKTKYLVKHHEMTDASNEYVAARLAEIMELPVVKAYLLKPDKRLSDTHAVAMEFLDGLETTGAYREINEQEKDDVIAHFAFSMMVDNIDIFQLRKYNGRIVQIDFADTFCMNSMLLKMAYGLGMQDNVDNLLRNYRESYARSVSSLNFDLSILARDLDTDPEKVRDKGIQVAKRVWDVKEEDIKDIENVLLGLYPQEYVDVYIVDIKVLQEKVKKF